MCLASTPDAPKAAAPAPSQQNYANSEEVMDSANNNRRKAAAAQGFQSTVLTGASGLSGGSTSKKTLLGQ